MDNLCVVTEIEECDFSKLTERTRPLNIERQRSCDERSLNELTVGFSPRFSVRNTDSSSSLCRMAENLDGIVFSPGRRSGFTTPRSQFGFEPHPMIGEAWEALRRSLVYFRGNPVGTIAALDNSEEELNYDQVFVRDFVPSALAFLMNGEPDIVKNFLLKTLRLQSWEKKIDSMIDRRMGVYGYPIEIQALFFMALRCALVLLKQDDEGKECVERIVKPIESHEWRITTGCDPKNTRWSYHNGGSWPVLLWLLTAASIKTGRPQIARRAIDLAEVRLLKDSWPEYYDGKLGRYVGKQARKFQTWSIAGYLVAKMMLEDPSHLGMISLEEDKQLKPLLRRSHSWTNF
ncbi:hypothetical protein QYF36_025606 [Acer negundo]|nr:hypothetical protein QYF36_025606 [Acer negundo]